MRLAIVGSGYVGLVTGTCLAELGHTVVCVDTDAARIDSLKAGVVPIYEPGLAELVAGNAAGGRLSFSTDLAGALRGAEAAFIAVGTPRRPEDGHPEMSYVREATAAIARAASNHLVVINKSTVPIGTGDTVEALLAQANPDLRFSVASNPEFLREGLAIHDFMKPDRIVVGVEDDWSRNVLRRIYDAPTFRDVPVMFTSRRSAELVKYASNAFLAMKITFINEIADLCEKTGGDIADVAAGIGLDGRIGARFLNPGPGYGGSCFPKDTMAITQAARGHDTVLQTIETVIQVNENRKRAMARKAVEVMGGEAAERTVAVLGLTFKADTDDMRDSPALTIVRALQDEGAQIRAHDPEGMDNARPLMPGVTFCSDAYAAAEGADLLLVVTEWPVFAALDFARIKAALKRPVVLDLRNFLDGKALSRLGLAYHCLGRAGIAPAPADDDLLAAE